MKCIVRCMDFDVLIGKVFVKFDGDMWIVKFNGYCVKLCYVKYVLRFC